MIDTKQLRQKILDLAIRGKLVPQDPNDEPASVLLERIKAEKERLIAQGKIKRSKKSTKSADTYHYENVPFEIPESWEWVKLSVLCSFLSRGKSPKYADNIKKYPVFAQKCNLYDGDISLEKARFLDPNTLSRWADEYKLRDGDVLINSTGTGTVGRTRLFHSDVLGDYPFVVPDSHVSVVRTFEEIASRYAYAYLISSIAQKHLEENLAGSTNQRELYIDVLENLQFPLPPYKEQIRIVDEISKWFVIVDKIENAKGNLQDYIKQTKSKVLQLAISGKLVSQDPNDEPAIELLKRINPSFVPCDTSHYENLPQGWQVTQMQAICDLSDGEKQEGMKRINLDVKYLRGQSCGTMVDKGKYVPACSTMILVDGENSGEIFTSPVEGYQGSTFKLLQVAEEVYKPFVLYVIRSHQRELRENKVGSAIPHLNKKLFRSLELLVPPYSEQVRIVRKIDEILKELDGISAEL